MSKRIARQRTRGRVKQQKKSRRNLIIMSSVLLSLALGAGIMARWSMLPGMTKPPLMTSSGSFNANSPSKEYIYAGGRLIATEEPAASAPPPAPTSFLATAQPTQSTSLVHLTWTQPSGSFDHYQIEYKLHKNDPQWTVVNANLAATATSYDDTTATANTAYLYRVCAVTGSQATCTAPDLATTTYFQDYPFQSNQTPIRAQHFLDLMNAVNAVRTLAELSTMTWSPQNPSPAVGGAIYGSHLNDLRNGLSEALSTLGLGTPQYEAPVPVVSGTQVKASQLQQLQLLVR